MDDEEDPFLTPPVPKFTSTPRRPQKTPATCSQVKTGGTDSSQESAGVGGGPMEAGEGVQAEMRGRHDVAVDWWGQSPADQEAVPLDAVAEQVLGAGAQGLDQGAVGGGDSGHEVEGHADAVQGHLSASGDPQVETEVEREGEGAVQESLGADDLKQMCLLCNEKVDEKEVKHNQLETLSTNIKLVYRYVLFFVVFCSKSADFFHIKTNQSSSQKSGNGL